MSSQSGTQRQFQIYVTHVTSEGPFLKICGQPNKPSACMVETLIEQSRDAFEKGVGMITPAAILEGTICVAKYKDGAYYRAKIVNKSNLANGLVGVDFVDYGNKDFISISTIRSLEKYEPMLSQLPGQAIDYYLASIINYTGKWEEQVLLKLQALLCYSEYPAIVQANTRRYPIISIQFQGSDLSDHLVANRYGISTTVEKQEMLLLPMVENNISHSNWQPSYTSDPPPNYTEHVPYLSNQNFPSNPASTMRLHQMLPSLPFNGNFVTPPPSSLNQRLLLHKQSRTPTNIRTTIQHPQQAISISPTLSPVPIQQRSLPSTMLTSKEKATTYETRTVKINSQYQVLVSFAEGPHAFNVHFATEINKLEQLMKEINNRPYSSLPDPPSTGTVCLARIPGEQTICRAIVTESIMLETGPKCKVLFVDFGDTETVSYYDIFNIPEEFVKPYIYSLKFSLSGLKKVESPQLNHAFKELVVGKMLTLKVVREGPPIFHYAELYLDNKNVLDLMLAAINEESLEFQRLSLLPLGCKKSVLVSYVDSCVKFFVQLSDNIDELNNVMEAVKNHCEGSLSPGDLPVGAACCARFPDDGNWYRATIKKNNGARVLVVYVDYGNEQEVSITDLRTITADLIQFPAQSLKCALKGFEDKTVETKTSNQLEMLALEKTLMAHVVGTLSDDTMLVTLVDCTVSPPLDVAKRMMQLSQPRGNVESKATTPVWKDAPETSFSSPEGSVPDDGRRKSFRREKSFKEDRRVQPKEPADDTMQRGGSFRGKDRRTGAKPWEREENIVSITPDEWEDPPALQPPPNRHNRDRRKPRMDQQNDRAGPKGGARAKNTESSSVSKRLHIAAESTGVTPNLPRSSVQERLRRDYKPNKSNEWEENKDVGNKNKFERRDGGRRDDRRDRGRDDRRDNRGDRSDYRGDRNEYRGDRNENRSDRNENRGDRNENRGDRGEYRGDRNENRGDRNDNRGFRNENRGERNDNYRDKKESYNKRDFRDNKPERGGHSNYTPRDRFERASSDRSFGSDGGRPARSSYKPRSKFTEVQYKELTSPVSLETPYTEQQIEPNTQHEVSITWIIAPDSFYIQIIALQTKFVEMMQKIPELYKGVKPYTGTVPIGASVLAKFPEDGVLYRATIVSGQPFGKYIVQYVDFGNKCLVDANDLWQLDQELMELPKMALHCSLSGLEPAEGEWKTNNDIDLCFNSPRHQCIFQEEVDEKHAVSLWNNGVSVADLLVEKQFAIKSDQGSSVTLKDEAIDLTIIVGQQMLCRVTHVESFDKFYVQLDMDKAALVESAIADFDSSLLTPLSAESLINGVHCTVKYEGKVYRAILMDISNPDSIAAILPDYGKSITTSVDNVMILPTELSVYYYQSLVCTLNNYTEESNKLMTLEELKEKLTGNNFIIYLNDVDGITLVSTLYDSISGQKIAIFEPDEGAYDEVTPLCMRAVFNYNFGMAYISHSENLNEIYLQKSTDSDRIAQLLDELFKFYEEGTPEALPSIEPESICAAKSSDDNWYRAVVMTVTDTDCKVQFSDYGNTESIPLDSVKKLDPKFYQPYSQALVASLGLVSLKEDALPKLIEWTADKEIQVTLSIGTDGWLANFHLDGVDLSVKLINEELATPQIIPSEEAAEVPSEDAPASLVMGCTKVYVSHVDTPGQFWLQMSEKIDSIEKIQAELQLNSDGYPEVDNRELGTLCIAKYSADDQWYRAEILDSDVDITTVRFIDYGNTDVLDNQPGVLKAIPDHLKEIERYAVKSSVNATPTGTGQWSEPASDYFTQLLGDFSVPVDALIVLKDITTYVDIYVNGENLTDKLVSEGHATKSEEPVCGDLPSCFASHVNSPSEFWIQLEAATSDLQAMETAMVDAETFPELREKEEGVICAAKYPEDGAWYRAQIIVDGSEGTEVLFMDYGNASIATELRDLSEELKLKPALSRKCALQKPRDVNTWSRKSEMKFNELAAEGATIFNVQFIASGDISIVELYYEGKSITEELLGLCEDHVPQERPTPVGQELFSNGKVCAIHSLEEFYIQLDGVTDLEKVVEKMLDCEDFEIVSELKVGSLCAAFWIEDEQWYRAKILEFCDIGAHCQLVDYGIKTKCEEFRQLPEDILSIEPIAKCCKLSGINSDMPSEVAKKKFESIVADDPKFQIEFIDTTKEPSLVRLILNGEDFSTVLINSVTLDSIQTTNEDSKTETKSDELCEELNTSQPELNESLESNTTVIENKSFLAENIDLNGKAHTEEKSAGDQQPVADDIKEKLPINDDLDSSSETLKAPSDDSKDSINTDLGDTDDVKSSTKILKAQSDDSHDSLNIGQGEVEIPSEILKAPSDDSNDSITTDLDETSDVEKLPIVSSPKSDKIHVDANSVKDNATKEKGPDDRDTEKTVAEEALTVSNKKTLIKENLAEETPMKDIVLTSDIEKTPSVCSSPVKAIEKERVADKVITKSDKENDENGNLGKQMESVLKET